MPNQKSLFMKPCEVAEMIGVHPQTLYLWRTKKLGPRYVQARPLGAVRYVREAVMNFKLEYNGYDE